MGDQVGRVPQYEKFADEFLAHAQDGFANAHYDRPACLSLSGPVCDGRVTSGDMAAGNVGARR